MIESKRIVMNCEHRENDTGQYRRIAMGQSLAGGAESARHGFLLRLREQHAEARRLDAEIKANLTRLGFGTGE